MTPSSRAGRPRRIVVVGSGYVARTDAACLAALGNDVTFGHRSAIRPEFVFLCLSAAEVLKYVLRHPPPRGTVLVLRSTTPLGFGAALDSLLGSRDVPVVVAPEFLRRESAVRDFLFPQRVVIGSRCPGAVEETASLYAALSTTIVRTDLTSAELVKFATHGLFAAKLSYVDAMAELCEHLGANVSDVARMMGSDPRIGREFLQPGAYSAESCLARDTLELVRAAERNGCQTSVFRAVAGTDTRHCERVVDKVVEACGGSVDGARLGLLGLAADATQAVRIVRSLHRKGAELVAFDPALSDVRELGELVTVVDDPYQVAKGATGIVVVAGCPSLRTLDWSRVAALVEHPVVVDLGNLLDPWEPSRAGVTWHGAGCPPVRGCDQVLDGDSGG